LHGRAGRLTAKNAGFRHGQYTSVGVAAAERWSPQKARQEDGSAQGQSDEEGDAAVL
jgi:hypothetical protein